MCVTRKNNRNIIWKLRKVLLSLQHLRQTRCTTLRNPSSPREDIIVIVMKDVQELMANEQLRADFDRWINATDEERIVLAAENDARYKAMDAEQKEKFRQAVMETINNVYDDVAEMKAEEETELLRQRVEGLSEALSLKYIAKNYFDKSSAWLYQRLNGNVVNGKKMFFNMKEIAQFKAALNDLSAQLSAAAA